MIWTYFHIMSVLLSLDSLMHVCISIYRYELTVYCALSFCVVCVYVYVCKYIFVCVCVCVRACVCVLVCL